MTNAQPSPRLDWTLGDRLYKSLRVSGLSNGEIAAELGVSRNTIGNYIADRTEPKDGQVKLWALRTGIPYEELRYGIVRGGSGDGGPAEGRTMDYGSDGSPRKSAIVSDFGRRTAA